jgi:hypothetical protein
MAFMQREHDLSEKLLRDHNLELQTLLQQNATKKQEVQQFVRLFRRREHERRRLRRR